LKWKHSINKCKNTTGENKISTEVENFELLSRKPISIAITILALPHNVHVFKFRFGKCGLKGVIQGVGTSLGGYLILLITASSGSIEYFRIRELPVPGFEGKKQSRIKYPLVLVISNPQ
jgi:hypothetical protein